MVLRSEVRWVAEREAGSTSAARRVYRRRSDRKLCRDPLRRGRWSSARTSPRPPSLLTCRIARSLGLWGRISTAPCSSRARPSSGSEPVTPSNRRCAVFGARARRRREATSPICLPRRAPAAARSSSSRRPLPAGSALGSVCALSARRARRRLSSTRGLQRRLLRECVCRGVDPLAVVLERIGGLCAGHLRAPAEPAVADRPATLTARGAVVAAVPRRLGLDCAAPEVALAQPRTHEPGCW